MPFDFAGNWVDDYDQDDPNRPMSPFEQNIGRRWTDQDNTNTVNTDDKAFYESGGMRFPGWEDKDRAAYSQSLNPVATPAPSTAPIPAAGAAPTPSSGQPSRSSGQSSSQGSLPPVQAGGDSQQDLIAQLMQRLQQGFQPQPQYGDEVVRLMRGQEERAAAEAQKRAGFEEQLRASLMDLIKRGQQPVDPDAVANTQEAKAFARVRERALGRYRAGQAEQRAAQGLGQNQQGEVSGALASDIQGGEAELAEQIAAFESRLIADQINKRRAELMQALQLGAGMLSGEQSNAIRRELAQLDAALRRETFNADLGLRSFLGGGQLSLGLLGSLNQNQQFYDQMGYNQDYANADLWLRRLGLGLGG